MNYGYNQNCKGWNESKKQELLDTLAKELPLNIGWTAGGVSPYLELDGAYGGVRIRKITHFAEEDRKQLVERADKIYWMVMA